MPSDALLLFAANPAAPFSMVSGEFCDVYRRQSDAWDAVVTSFFLDTAPNVIEYMEVIFNILKPGGVWINFGPLLYHWQQADSQDTDERFEQSVELSYSEIRAVAGKMGFVIQKEALVRCTYCACPFSLMHTAYTAVFFTYEKPLTPAGPSPRIPPSPSSGMHVAASPSSGHHALPLSPSGAASAPMSHMSGVDPSSVPKMSAPPASRR